ncbi:Nucleolar protein 12 [Basidiobolus ranarum]|uniref:Nucleolar protein 12 n=1 Tax=Basidiobolus ranarum TaxID=34480 RepID=A0ABR2X4B2_9FUNG
MSNYVPGQLAQSLLGGAKVDSKLDDLFKNSAGASSLPPPVLTTRAVKPAKKEIEKRKEAEAEDEDSDGQPVKKQRVNAKPASERNVSRMGKTEASGKIGEKETKVKEDEPEKIARTIFVGNLSVSVINKTEYKQLKARFAEFGEIESIRFRSVAFAELMPRKAAFINKNLHPERNSVNAYIVYKEKAGAQAALKTNGTMFLERHLRVDKSDNTGSQDRKTSVFVGNLAFDVDEEDLWQHFTQCGEVVNVRIIRDKTTNVGKGFGYVQFKERPAVGLALQLHESKMGTRKLRVFRCSETDMVKGKNPVKNSDKSKNDVKKPRGKTMKPKTMLEGERSVKNKKARVRTRTQAWKKTGRKPAQK